MNNKQLEFDIYENSLIEEEFENIDRNDIEDDIIFTFANKLKVQTPFEFE